MAATDGGLKVWKMLQKEGVGVIVAPTRAPQAPVQRRRVDEEKVNGER